MKNLLQILILASVVASATASAALASNYPTYRQEVDRELDMDYGDRSAESRKAGGDSQKAGVTNTPDVSQYPCPRCVYDHKLGGYVAKNYGKTN